MLSEIQKRIPDLIREYKVACKIQKGYKPKSWIDYFLIGNVYIIGFGMDPSEMDIWWLINCKKRNFNDLGNIFLYEPNLGNKSRFAIKALCDTFNISYELVTANGGSQYLEYYRNAVEHIQSKLL